MGQWECSQSVLFVWWWKCLFKKIFNCRIITLHYCDGLCHTSAWAGHRYTYVPSLLYPLSPPSPSHPSRLSQSTGFRFPASYSKLPLAIYFTYGNVYVSMPFSQIIPMQIKNTMRRHFTRIRMAIIKKSTNDKCWRRCEEKGMLLDDWWECKFVHPL